MSLSLPGGFTLLREGCVSSTNDLAKDMARQGYAARTLIWALEQKGGRGRQGNRWESPPGNLYMSLLLRPEKPAWQVGQLSFVAAVALAETVSRLLPDGKKVALKWPNDLLIEDKKAAGILLESETGAKGAIEWVVMGLGVNVSAPPPIGTGLHAQGAAQASVEKVLEALCHELVLWLGLWERGEFDKIRERWLRHAKGIGEKITVRLPSETLSGVFSGLDGSGALLLAQEDGSQRNVTAGEVYFG